MPKLFLRVQNEARVVEHETIADGVEDLEETSTFALDVQWLVAEADGSVRGSGECSIEHLTEIVDPQQEWLADPDNIIVFVPSEFVLRVACEVPGRSTAQIRRALPFAVEEFVAAEIESMHIAHGPIRAGEPVACNLVTEEQIRGWLGALAPLGIRPGYMLAESEVLSQDRDVATLIYLEDNVLVAHQEQAAVLNRDALTFALGGMDVQRLQAVGGRPSDVELSQLPNPVQLEELALNEEGLLGYLAAEFSAPDVRINLLQGEYQPVHRSSVGMTRIKGVLGLAAAWVVIAFLGMVVQGFWASSQADRLSAESFEFYQSVFPRESQPVSIDQLRRRMAAKLGQKVGDSESVFVGLTAEIANSLSPTDAVLSMNYTANNQELSLDVMLASYDVIDALEGKLRQKGIAMENLSAEAEDERVRARLRFKYAS